MREILFRGKRNNNGEWVYGNLFIPDKKDTPAQICVGTSSVRITYDINPSTIGQYTGSTDKNDKKIFEGDIVKSYNGHIGWVEFRRNTFVKRCYCHLFGNAIHGDDQIVIGNIYDNPELLRGDTE